MAVFCSAIDGIGILKFFNSFIERKGMVEPWLEEEINLWHISLLKYCSKYSGLIDDELWTLKIHKDVPGIVFSKSIEIIPIFPIVPFIEIIKSFLFTKGKFDLEKNSSPTFTFLLPSFISPMLLISDINISLISVPFLIFFDTSY